MASLPETVTIEVRRGIILAAWTAVQSIGVILNDPKVGTHGLTQSQLAGLQSARDELLRALP